MKKETSAKGLLLYEEVLQKNFEIIQTFLNKFPAIFKKQDNFEESLKKINDKLFALDHDNDKYREEIHMSINILDKKILHLKENTARNNRSSSKFSQEMAPLEQRKNSIFRISTTKEQKEAPPTLSKEKNQLLQQIDKRQQQNIKKISQLQEYIFRMQEKINFMSVINGKTEQSVDKIIEQKVDKNIFEQLARQFQYKFQKEIKELVENKYKKCQQFINQGFQHLENTFKSQIERDQGSLKLELLAELQKKAAILQFKEQLKQIKTVIQRMVDQSIQSFASKEETKKVLQLFQKKFTKVQLVIEQLLLQNLKPSHTQSTADIFVSARKQKDGLLNNFGRKRRTNQKHPS